jgi:malonate transporter and related proteins
VLVSTVIAALLPLVVTLAFGYFAGWHRDFSADQAAVLNRMVMLYALPLSLFCGMVTATRGEFTSDVGLLAAIACTMVGAQLVTIVIARFVFHRSLGVAALAGLFAGGPALPFAGPVVLGHLFGAASVIPVAGGSLVTNLFQTPLTLVLLSLASTSVAVAPARKLARRSRRGVRLRAGGGAGSRVAGLAAAGAGASGGQASLTATMASASTPAPAAGAAGSGPVTSRTSASSASSGGLHLRRHLAAAFKEPVVVAPVTALILVLAGVSLPSTVVQSLKLLGTTSTGAALFALGIVLYAQRITLSKSVLTLTAARNVLVPAVLWAALVALGASHMLVREAVVALALPAVLIVTILSVQYKQSEREMASVMFFSYVLAIVTVGAFITLT